MFLEDLVESLLWSEEIEGSISAEYEQLSAETQEVSQARRERKMFSVLPSTLRFDEVDSIKNALIERQYPELLSARQSRLIVTPLSRLCVQPGFN